MVGGVDWGGKKKNGFMQRLIGWGKVLGGGVQV